MPTHVWHVHTDTHTRARAHTNKHQNPLLKRDCRFTTVYVRRAGRGGMETPLRHNRNTYTPHTPRVPSQQDVQESLPPTPKDHVEVIRRAKKHRAQEKSGGTVSFPGTNWKYSTSCAETPDTFFFIAKSHRAVHSSSLCRSGHPLGFSKTWCLYCLTLPGMHVPWVTHAQTHLYHRERKVCRLSKMIPTDAMVFPLFPSLPTPSIVASLLSVFYLHFPSTSHRGQWMVSWVKSPYSVRWLRKLLVSKFTTDIKERSKKSYHGTGGLL